MKKRIALLTGFIALASVAHAVTNTWDGGGGDSYWTNSLNWDTDLAPTANDVVIIDTAVAVDPTGLAGANLPLGCKVWLTNGATLNQPSGAVRLNGATINVAPTAGLYGAFWDLNNGTLNFEDGAEVYFNDWEQKGTNTFRFNFSASGFTTLYPSVFRVSSAEQFTNATYVIDLASYAGGATNITLVDFSSVSSSAIITPNNFLLNAKKSILNPGVFTNSTIVYNASTLSIVAKISSTPIPPDKVWDGGGGDSLWVTANNWNPDSIPVVNEIVGITNAVTVDGLGLTGGGSLPLINLSLSGGAGLTMSSGAIRLQGALINVASNSTLSGAFWDLNNGTIRFDDGAKVTFNDWEQKGINRFDFKLGPNGFATLTPNRFRGATGVITNASYNVDMAAFTGGIGPITLVDFNFDNYTGGMSNLLFQTAKLRVLNAGVGYAANLQWDDGAEAIVLNVTAAPGYNTYYWDNNGTNAGFGSASGTWASPTTGDATQGWSLDGTGSTEPVSVTSGKFDTINFGNGATGLGAGTITVSGSVTNKNLTFASGSGEIILSGGTINFPDSSIITVNNASNTISSALAGSNLTKAGGGTLTLGNANSHTGVTTVSGGILKITDAGALGTTTSNTVVAGGGSLRLSGGLTLAEPLNITGNGVGGAGALMSGGSNTITAPITSSAARFQTESNSTLTLTGGINSTADGTIFVGDFTINSNPINVGTKTLSFAGDGSMVDNTRVITLNAAGNSWGDALLFFNARLKLGANNVMPAGASLRFGWSTVSNSTSKLNLNGFNQTVATIETTTSPIVSPGGDIQITGGGTLTVDQSAATKTFTGVISDGATATALTKTGSGTLILSGTNTYSGNTTVSNGVLRLTSDVGLGSGTKVYLLTASGSLDLAFTGTNDVTALYIDGAPQPDGVYGSSTAPITGSGFLRVGAVTPPPGNFSGISVSGQNLALSVTNGSPGGTLTLLSSTNVTLPLIQWTTNFTANYDGSGNFTTNLLNTATNQQEFFILK